MQTLRNTIIRPSLNLSYSVVYLSIHRKKRSRNVQRLLDGHNELVIRSSRGIPENRRIEDMLAYAPWTTWDEISWSRRDDCCDSKRRVP